MQAGFVCGRGAMFPTLIGCRGSLPISIEAQAMAFQAVRKEREVGGGREVSIFPFFNFT